MPPQVRALQLQLLWAVAGSSRGGAPKSPVLAARQLLAACNTAICEEGMSPHEQEAGTASVWAAEQVGLHTLQPPSTHAHLDQGGGDDAQPFLHGQHPHLLDDDQQDADALDAGVVLPQRVDDCAEVVQVGKGIQVCRQADPLTLRVKALRGAGRAQS